MNQKASVKMEECHLSSRCYQANHLKYELFEEQSSSLGFATAIDVSFSGSFNRKVTWDSKQGTSISRGEPSGEGPVSPFVSSAGSITKYQETEPK